MDSKELYWHMRAGVSAGGHGWGAGGSRTDEQYREAHDADHAVLDGEIVLTHDHKEPAPEPDLSITFGDGTDGDTYQNVLKGLAGYVVNLNGVDVQVDSVGYAGLTFHVYDNETGGAGEETGQVDYNDGPLSIHVY